MENAGRASLEQTLGRRGRRGVICLFGPRHLLRGWSYLLAGQEINRPVGCPEGSWGSGKGLQTCSHWAVWGVFRLSKCLWCGMRGRTQFPHPGLCLTHQGSMLVASLVYMGVRTPVSKPSLQESNAHCFYFMLSQIQEPGSGLGPRGLQPFMAGWETCFGSSVVFLKAAIKWCKLSSVPL